MKYLPFILTILLFFTQCRQTVDTSAFVNVEQVVSDEIFPNTIQLRGQQIVPEKQQASEIIFHKAQILFKDSILVVLNQKDQTPIHLYKIPDFQYLGAFGNIGRGPAEFLYPRLIASDQPDVICYIFESANGTLYQLTKELKLQRLKAGALDNSFSYQSRELIYIHHNNLAYISTMDDSKFIFQLPMNGNNQDTLYNLALDKKIRSPYAYIGISAANLEKERIVYAYNYFKVVKFISPDAKKIKTLNFNLPGFDMQTLQVPDGLDLNHLYYWGSIVAQPNHVYIETVNKSAGQLQLDKEANTHVTEIEQYDWNGNPIRKIKLDKEGRFALDEKNGKIYLLSEKEDNGFPFYVYTLPDSPI